MDIKPYIHTLTLTVNHDPIPRIGILQRLAYVFTKDENPTWFEPIPASSPSSTIRLALDFDKIVLQYMQYPPDAHCGWDLPATILINLLYLFAF